MARLRYNGLSTTLGASLTSSATAVTFAAALTHSGGTAVPTISAGDSIPLSILDSTGKLSEVVYLTAYTSGATTGTITRGQESTTGVSHASGDRVVHGPMVSDLASGASRVLLKEFVLSATTASVTFASADIPAGVRNLIVRITGRSSASAVNDQVNFTFNGDTTDANYETKIFYGSTSTTGYNVTANRATGFIAGATATAGRPGCMDLVIQDALATAWNKVGVATFYSPGTPLVGQGALLWKNAAAISSILVAPASGSFVAGTRIALYADMDIAYTP